MPSRFTASRRQRCLRWAAVLWAAPNSLLGLALGLVLLPVGAQARLVEGVLEITALRRPPRRCGPFAAITLGHVVVATHADRALSLLMDPDAEERRILSAFRYSRNEAVLHRDAALMPQRRRAWARRADAAAKLRSRCVALVPNAWACSSMPGKAPSPPISRLSSEP